VDIQIFPTKDQNGQAAAALAAKTLNAAILARGEANLILATGASQFEMLTFLVQASVDWSKVTAYHLDEYTALADSHPASFRRYLRERFVGQVPLLKQFVPVLGDSHDPAAECRRLGGLLAGKTIDLACIGIGENGHLAFNDPPVDFETEEPFLVVNLDEACRRQQLGEGWFKTLADVPSQAISMSIRQIMKSAVIVCTVPDLRKAAAVVKAVEGPVTNMLPASILQQHPKCTLFLDKDSASLLKK
jgi:glucosamine-6-phosphate deaminase